LQVIGNNNLEAALISAALGEHLPVSSENSDGIDLVIVVVLLLCGAATGDR